MLTLQIVDARKRFLIAAALRFYKLTGDYCQLRVRRREEICMRHRASNDRFRLAVTLASNLANLQMFDSEVIARFLTMRCLELLERNHLPEEPAKFLRWLGSLQRIMAGAEASLFEDVWFDEYLEYPEPQEYWCSKDELVLLMQDASETDMNSAVRIKEWLAKRPDLTVRSFSKIPPDLLAAESEDRDVRRTLISQLLHILDEQTLVCRCSDGTKGIIWQDVVAEANVVFLNELLDMCHDDGLKLLATDIIKSQELLPRLQPLIDPNVFDELSLRLKAASANRGSEAA